MKPTTKSSAAVRASSGSNATPRAAVANSAAGATTAGKRAPEAPTTVRILGCSGGIGGRHLRTTSLLVDHDLLVDAGTGVEDLSLPELQAIHHVLITHSHLDHIAALPMLLDTVGDTRGGPLTVYALPETIATLQAHIFNWQIWPDFTCIPDTARPLLHFRPISLGETLIFGTRRITVLPAVHTVPAVGYHIDSGHASLVFSGDTTTNDALWPIVNGIDNLKALIIETAFPDRERELAVVSRHLCPSLLAAELKKLQRQVALYITHLKPGQIETTMREIEERVAGYGPRMLQHNQVFEL